jgi:methionine synthase II (cobalamin-independent)
MYKESIYRKMLKESEDLKYRGFQYQDTNIIERFVSNRMFGNPIMAGFLRKINPIMIDWIESVKRVQFFYNYIIDKNDNSINR